MKDTLILSGGGLLGLSMLGALEEIFQEYSQQQFKYIAGSSVGALIGVLLCMCSPIHLCEIVQNINIFDENNIDFTDYFEKFGFVKSDTILNILSQYIPEACTFKEFFEITGVHIKIVGTNLTYCRKEYFDYLLTPSMRVSDAVCISINIPFVFHQITYNNSIYTDGCVSESFPWNAFDISDSRKLGIQLESVQEFTPSDFFYYIQSLVNTLLKTSVDLSSPRVLKLCVNFPILQEYTPDDIIKLYKFGQNEARAWFKKIK